MLQITAFCRGLSSIDIQAVYASDKQDTHTKKKKAWEFALMTPMSFCFSYRLFSAIETSGETGIPGMKVKAW